MINKIAITLMICGLAAQGLFADVFEDLANYEYGDESKAGEAIEALLQETPVGEYGRLEQGLIGVVASNDATQTGKAIACRMLQQVGTEKCIPAVSALLGDEVLSHYARLVLERLKDEKADQAMRDALQHAPAKVKTGLLGSLGERRDAKAVPLAGQLAQSDDPDVATAAIRALGKIGGSQAAQRLAALKPDRLLVPIQMQAMVTCAASLSGDEAAALCETVLAGTYSPSRIAALRALASADAAKAAPMIAKALKGDNLQLRKGALGIVADTKGAALTQAMLGLLGALSPERKAGLVLALGSRGDKAALDSVTRLIKSGETVVRDAAIKAVSKLGDAGTVRILLGMADSPDLRARVAEAISRMTDDKVDQALADALEEAGLRKSAIEASIARGCTAAVPGLLKLAADHDAATRKEAWAGLAALAGEDHMDAIMKAVVQTRNPQDLADAEQAIKQVTSRAEDKGKCFKVIADYFDKVPDATKGVILTLGAVSGDPDALAMERKALASGNKALYSQALRALADRLVALRGYIRIAGLETARLTGAQRTQMLKTAMGLADRTDEKKQVVSSLQNATTLEALNMLKQYMDDPALRAEAEMAAATLTWNLRTSHPAEAIASAQELLKSRNKTVADKASKTIADLTKARAYVRAWLVSDTYRVKGKDGQAIHKTAFPPEEGDKDVTWKRLAKGIGKDTINLEAAIGAMEHSCVYVKTTLESPSEQTVRLALGSDDGIKVWLNGKLVHDHWVTRGCTPGQDVAKVKLNKGRNVLLLKISNEGTHWAFSCSLTQPNGTPVKGLRVRPQ